MSVKKCINPYCGDDLPGFQKFPFQLDDFQKYAIQAIDNNENVLVMAGTGSGKTVCAEYAIYRALELGKKVIYTSPIKSLSNQKFNEFNKKFPGDIVGILTGDIKYNPEGQILIMTTEILRNLLYQDEIKIDPVSGTSLKVNIKEEVSSVIFDEVHYINDPDRGKVWEESLILLPKTVDLVLLSATISGAESFGRWLQDIKQKPLNLTGNTQRVIPLKHYFYLCTKSLTNKGVRLEPLDRIFLENHTNKLIPILDEKMEFYEDNIYAMQKIKNKFRSLLPREGVLNDLLTYLKFNNMLPAIFFIFSRKNCERYAKMINKSFNTSEEQANVEKIIQFHLHKLDYPESYQHLPQFTTLKQLLLKGIAYHHSGLIPVFKEIIEILFAKNLVKVLMATETFAVGINMPTKTVVYTALDKYDSTGQCRWLRTHEYLQMSGRAGRRGMDKVGYVIHLPNMGDIPSANELRIMMMGNPQIIQSKFSLNYQFILKAILTDNVELDQIIRASLWSQEMEGQLKYLKEEQERFMEMPKNDYQDCYQYDKLMSNTLDGIIKLNPKSVKKNKQKAKKMLTPAFRNKYQTFKGIQQELEKRAKVEAQVHGLETEIEFNLRKILQFLQDKDYVSQSWNPEEPFKITSQDITVKGVMASQVNQCQELWLAEIVSQNILDGLSAPEIACLLSLFLDHRHNNRPLNQNESKPVTLTWNIHEASLKIKQIGIQLADEEDNRHIYLPSKWIANFELMGITYQWALEGNKLRGFDLRGMFAGEFVKEMIKISHLAEEVTNLAEILQKVQLKIEAEKVPGLIIKDVVGVDSLYIK